MSKELGLKNAERGTIAALSGTKATIRWDRGERLQDVDLAQHKTWDHGYAETVFSSQSKTYDRAYVLAPVNSSLVNGQNYYTAITRARFGVKLWTEDERLLAQRLEQRSGEKSSALEALGRLSRDRVANVSTRHRREIQVLRNQQQAYREQARLEALEQGRTGPQPFAGATRIAENARDLAGTLSRYLNSLLNGPEDPRFRGSLEPAARNNTAPTHAPTHTQPAPDRGPDR